MCGVGIISLNSTNCTWAQTADHHTWQKYTYTLCHIGVANNSPCNNAQSVDGQTDVDKGSTRMRDCPVCKKLEVALREREENTRRVEEEYARAYAAAFREEMHIYPLDSPPGPSRNRESRYRDDRHDSDKLNGSGGRGKHYERDRYHSHDYKGKGY